MAGGVRIGSFVLGLGLLGAGAGVHAQPRVATPSPAQVVMPDPLPEAPRVPLSLSAAVRSALQQHPALMQASAGVEQAQAQLRVAEGPFDAALTSALGYDRQVVPGLTTGPGVDQTLGTTAWSIGARKRLQFGTNIEAAVQLASQKVSPRGGPALKTAAVGLTVTQPLLRNAGNTAAASEVHAARFQERAAEFTLEHTAQAQVLEVIAAYFQVVAAEQSLLLAQTSLQRAQKILDETRTLVDADQRPRGDLRALEGNLANRRRDVIGAQAQRVRGLTALRLAMGLDARTRVDWEPTDALPLPQPPAEAVDALIEQALAARRDLKATQAIVSGTDALYRGAEHNTLPQLDLNLTTGYQGALEDPNAGAFFGTLFEPAGLNAGINLSLELPLRNHLQDGARDAVGAELRRARSALWDQVRTVRSEVAGAYDEVRLSIEQVKAAREGEQQYDAALADERYKLRAGLSTVIDVVLTEDLLTSATRSRISAQLQLALALLQLRFSMGALPANEAGVAAALPALVGGAADGG